MDIRVPEEWHEMSEKEFADWPLNHGYTTRQTVIWRGLMTPQQWRRYITGCRGHLRNLWRSRWGEKFEYVEVMEFHESGVPHLHLVYKKPAKCHLWGLQRWLENVWGKIVNETRYTPIVGVGAGFPDHTAEGGLNYALKYLTKDLNVRIRGARRDRAILHRILGLEDDEKPLNWNHNIRKICVSGGWPRAKAGDIDKFTTYSDGEIRTYNRTERERAYGRMYRVVMNDKYREAVLDGEMGVLSFQPVWTPTGPPDRFGYPTWESKGKRPGMTGEKALEAIGEWREVWMPVIANQVLQAQYDHYGENWEDTHEWKKLEDPNYWERVYQMPDGTIEPIK